MPVTPKGRGKELSRCPSPARRGSASSYLAWLLCARITVFHQPGRSCCGLAILHQEMWVITRVNRSFHVLLLIKGLFSVVLLVHIHSPSPSRSSPLHGAAPFPGRSVASSLESICLYPRYTATIAVKSGRMAPLKRKKRKPVSKASSPRHRAIRRIFS
jgi:hypothetical protein